MQAAREDCSGKSGYENRLTLLTVFVCTFTKGASAYTRQTRILFSMHPRARRSETVYTSPTLRAMLSLLDKAFCSQVFGRLPPSLLSFIITLAKRRNEKLSFVPSAQFPYARYALSGKITHVSY